MAAIFAKASLTFIAKGPDANYGLRGLRALSPARNFVQDVFEVKPGSKIIIRRWGRKDRLPETWSTRGWTFQEQLFSRRRIIFEDDSVCWECGRALWYEDTAQAHDQERVDKDVARDQAILSASFPDMLSLHDLVSRYNMRILTFPEDAIDAFAGVTSILIRSFKHGFLCGLSVILFDAGLLWQPHNHVSRRVAKIGTSSSKLLPSWSWVGWRGPIDQGAWEKAHDYVKCSKYLQGTYNSERIVPLVQWYSHETKKCKKTLIPIELYNYRLRYTDSTVAPPQGWTRHNYNPDPVKDRRDGLPPEALLLPRFFFKHRADPYSEFWYPVPLPDPEGQLKPSSSAPLLSCRTRRAWLYGSHRLANVIPKLRIHDKTGYWVGTLQLHENPPGCSGSDLAKHDLVGKPLELVEISGGYVYNRVRPAADFDEWEHGERPKIGDKYEFYNVLWIEWDNEIAYRKGLGRVKKDAWESQEREWIDLTLG